MKWACIIAFIFIILLVILKFNFFNFNASFRGAKIDIKGAQMQPQKEDSLSLNKPNSSNENSNVTHGNQSPIINNSENSVINYGSK